MPESWRRLADTSSPEPRLVIALASVAAFVVLGQAVASGLTAAFDLASVRSVAAWHGSFLDSAMRTVTELGGGIGLSFLTVIAVAVAAALRRWRSAIFLGLVFAGEDIASGVLKGTFLRPRPPTEFRPGLDFPVWENVAWIGLAAVLAVILWRTRWRTVGLLIPLLLVIGVGADRMLDAQWSAVELDSFPSGHATRSMGLAASLIVVAWSHPRRTAVIGLGVVTVLAIGFSRVYLGVHYPTDVLAGWLAALVVVLGLSLIPPIDPWRERAVRNGPKAVRPGLAGSPAEPPG